MRIYLDTRDLINLVQHSTPCSVDEFDERLRANGHELILSLANVLEISAPLLNKNSNINIMSMLNRIEAMPVKFIAESMIDVQELVEAMDAFVARREYAPINPYVDRLDRTLVDQRFTQDFINFGLAEMIFTLWTEDPSLFEGMPSHIQRQQEIFEIDRSIDPPPAREDHFKVVVERKLHQYQQRVSSDVLNQVADWIYSESDRCPSIRLLFEVHYAWIRNRGDTPRRGDIYDLTHISCLPYIDLITLDRRMATYALQAARNANMDYESRIFVNVEELAQQI